MKLTSDNVTEIIRYCLFEDNESHDNAVIVDGLITKFGFHPERLKEKKDDIISMLSDLPDPFYEKTGGGWSFLNLHETKSGEQWTGYHRKMEELVALGIAIDKAQFVLPKDMWKVLPGGMPYIMIKN